MHEAFYIVGSVVREGYFLGGEGMRAEATVRGNLAEVGWSVQFDSGREGCLL